MEKLKLEINKLQQTLTTLAHEHTQDELDKMRGKLDRLVSLQINWVKFKNVPVDAYENTLLSEFKPERAGSTHNPAAFNTIFEAGTDASQVETWFEETYGSEIWPMLL